MVASEFGSHRNSWASKTYSEIENIGASSGSILIVPVGSLEQHGYHLPVGTDTILVDAVSKTATERVTDDVPVLLTPPVWTGYSPHHLPFGGTITLEYVHLLRVLEDIVGTALENGFDSVLLLNGHGGNGPLIASAVSTIGTGHPDVEVHGLTYFELAASFIDEIRETDTGGMAHGGEFETSLMLHLRPELVDEDALEGTNLDEPYEWGTQDLVAGGPLSTYRAFTEYSESGAIGDPTVASAEKGEAILALLGDELEALLNQIHSRNQ